jgi:hypothetical protein
LPVARDWEYLDGWFNKSKAGTSANKLRKLDFTNILMLTTDSKPATRVSI